MASPSKARPTVYKGVQMRSRLEAGFAAWLDRYHFDWEYEPRAFASEEGQYLPDFQLSNVFVSWLENPATVFVEVKPSAFLADPGYPSTQEADEAFDVDLETLNANGRILAESEPGAVYVLAQPGHGLYLIEWDDQVQCRWTFMITLIALPDGKAGFASCKVDLPWEGEYWRPNGKGRKAGP